VDSFLLIHSGDTLHRDLGDYERTLHGENTGRQLIPFRDIDSFSGKNHTGILEIEFGKLWKRKRLFCLILYFIAIFLLFYFLL
jgi:hypothetical protein